MGEKLRKCHWIFTKGISGETWECRDFFFKSPEHPLITHIETGHYVKKYQNLFFQFWGTFNSLNLVT